MKSVDVSNLLRVLYFVAAVCIVAIHANTLFAVANPADWNVILHRVVCKWIPCWAVPFFFVSSGFFFGRGRYVAGRERWGSFARGKVRSVLLPYLMWSVLAALLLVPLTVANNLYTHHALLERTFLGQGDVIRSMGCLFGIGVYGGPCHNGPLWFLRSLALLFVLAPLWRFLARSRYGLILLVSAFFFVRCGMVPEFVYGYDWEFFFLGVVLSRILPVTMLERREGQMLSYVPVFVNGSFWLYCTHTIILGYVLAAGHFLFGKTDFAIAGLTLVAIPLTVSVSLFVGVVVEKAFPRFFTVLNGGRKL